MPSLLTHIDAARRLACVGGSVADIMSALGAHEITARQAIRWARSLSKDERAFYTKPSGGPPEASDARERGP